MSARLALIIANTEYTDLGLAQLTAPSKDAEDFARILKDKEVCAFDTVNVLLNQPSFVVGEAIDALFHQRKPDDLLIVYFSGHGVRDEFGTLYLAVKNTNRDRLRATAIRSDYIREAMDQSRSKRQVVILDCCNSGAFPQGTKAEVGGMMGIVSALQGYGRFVLTASDATQFAWEGDKIIGETQNSLFTHFLVKGLEGEADSDSDGTITVDELYDYAYEQISKLTPKQTPTKSSSKQEGEIVLRQISRIQDIKPASLPEQLISEIENPYPEVRLRAIQQLGKLLIGKNLGLVRSAREALEEIEKEDDSRRVSQAATQRLEPVRQVEHLAIQNGIDESKTSEEMGPTTNQEVKIQRVEEIEHENKEKAQLLLDVKNEPELQSREKAEGEEQILAQMGQMESESVNLVAYENKQQEVVSTQIRPAKSQGFLVIALITLALCGYGTMRLYSSVFGGERAALATSTPTLKPATTTPPKVTATIQNNITQTPSQLPPTLQAATNEIVAFVNVERAFFYEGPGQGYELANNESYDRGDKFECTAVDKSNYWLYCISPDNIQGWLFLDWVEISGNPSIIPTASYIPPIPPTRFPTRKPPKH